jgi:hypothetical protein
MRHIQPISFANSKCVLTLLSVAFMFCAHAQDGVGINTTTIDPHAILDIQNPSGTKGVKFPIAVHDDITSLQDPSMGILIFDREANQLYNSVKYNDISGNEVKEFDAIGWGMRGSMFLDSSKHFLGTQGNNSFILSANGLTNGGGNMVISPGGKIGINMDVAPLLDRPRAALDINGSIIIGTDYNVEEPGALQYDPNDDILMYFSQNGGWQSLGGGGGGSDNDWTIGSGIIYNLNDNVGIGTSSNNGYQLSLNTSVSGSNNTGIYNYQGGTHNTTGYGITSINNMTTNSTKYGFYNIVNATGTGIHTGIANYTYGSSSSSNEVQGIYSLISGSGSGTFYGIRLNNNGSGSGNQYGIYTTGEDYNYFEGNVGIGDVTTPTSNLQVQGTNNSNLIQFSNTTTGGGNGILTEITTSANTTGNRIGINARAWWGQNINYGGYFFGYGGTSSYGVFAAAGGSSSSSYAGYFSGSVYTTGTYQTSDRELKTEIQEFDNALEKLNEITINSYSYKQEGNFKKMNLPEGPQVGFMADNMKEVFPSLVKKTEFDFNQLDDNMMPIDNAEPNIFEFNAVNYAGMVPVLAKAIQEQQVLIEEQQAQIDQLKKEMEEIKSN